MYSRERKKEQIWWIVDLQTSCNLFYHMRSTSSQCGIGEEGAEFGTSEHFITKIVVCRRFAVVTQLNKGNNFVGMN